MGNFEDCFGDLPKDQQRRLLIETNAIKRIIGMYY